MTTPALSPELAQIIEEASGIDAETLTADARLTELGISSLAMIEIAVRIEDAFGVRLDDETVFGLTTVGDLAAHINAHSDTATAAPGDAQRAE
ncbi:MAG: acyl carrier protein [Corynebacterium sp.]|uniref:acyl carrier protein n=1 Tax=Corynebacterium sp. TaxID=1720 RepID=UPI0026E0B903|nr:acyl carrier protein [Corynebacterium sp.]MDO5670852.1 acyl carrier protein [Corynebacterium sp.]